MKKIVFLMFVIVSVIAANAQTSPNNSIITFSASDESYDIEARHNFVDVYFSDGTHFFLNYAIRYEHVKNGITTMTYMLTYHEGFKGNLVSPYNKGVISVGPGDNPQEEFYMMFLRMGSDKNKARRVTIRYNVKV